MNEHRKPGRPKAEQPSTSVSTWLKIAEHERLVKLAQDREQSVSSLVRQSVIFLLKK